MNTRDATALVQGASLGMGDTLFKFIPIGGLFRLAKNGEVYRRESERWYRPVKGGQRYMTGARTAVFAVPAEGEGASDV